MLLESWKPQISHDAPPAIGRPEPRWARVAHRPAAVADIEGALWGRAADRIAAASLADARVLLVGFDPEHRVALREHLRSLGTRVAAATPGVEQLPSVAGMGAAFTHVVVGFDAFEDVEAGVDALLALRRNAPGLVVILCSAMVGGDDLGGERSAICDATLRMPVSRDRLRAGLVAATITHAEVGAGARRPGER